MTEKLGAERHTPGEWREDLEALDMEIVRYAVICQVRLFDPGVIGHVLNNNALVCGDDHPTAFETLRGLLYLHFEMQKELTDAYGAGNAEQIIQRVREHLLPRIGEQLDTLFRRAD
ncbi:hypothetical protein [Herbaspirillum robiniae]|uniref:Uncharacterized protein n=1 Tax=Herbaspirillum robiniae TaxID=2014887 RepID=A0A246WVY9_9BURK|nr:hypothetical protein [Herbaspirillum robiniae]NUU01469.1 hypothetical protein [Herbaspirillum robiniae]OWY30516.1 hypothetical protein CEJ42_00020 [Herbaspirillum robiniae]